MDQRPWLKSYPAGVPGDIDPDRYASVVHAFHEACDRFKDKPCFTNMGVTLTYADLLRLSGQFAAFLRKDLGLVKGDRIGLQMPNVLQYPVALFGALRAGLVVVNTNPLYTPREMEHQYRDSGVKAVVILANFAKNLVEVLPNLKTGGAAPRVVVTEIGDLFPTPKRLIVNTVVKYVKKMVPAYDLPGAVSFRDALARGAAHPAVADVALVGSDLAFLQYTGGTTGVAKGAMLTHRNIIANLEQASAWMSIRLVEGEEIILTPLPLYHVFSLTVNCLLFMKYGGHNILVTNPRDFPAFIKLLQHQRFTVLTAVSTLLGALMNQPGFDRIDFSSVKLTVAGAMALQRAVADRWKALTKTTIVEGYGLTEASPILCCNPIDGADRLGTIGLPFPSTEVRLMDEEGQLVTAPGKAGELIARGPQVMLGYWNKPDETAGMLRDGWLWTGDIAQVDEAGFFKIVDRKKDMILVSGFNVYPSEVEEVVAMHPSIAEVGAIGVPDEKSGEAVKVVVVLRPGKTVTADELVQFCRTSLAAYKVPRHVEFRTELPKTNVGKVLRRALR
ncbi:MAG: AMP-binding protein [Deltaproteobacteria bacterium]|nr:AMP-binding protein [Deltaproteobacteria bacterium]